jgi:molecular chaperone DnaK
LNGNDADAIKRATEELQTRFQGISAELYKQAASQKSAEQPGASGGSSTQESGARRPGENVVDADFEVVDEDKKKS